MNDKPVFVEVEIEGLGLDYEMSRLADFVGLSPVADGWYSFGDDVRLKTRVNLNQVKQLVDNKLSFAGDRKHVLILTERSKKALKEYLDAIDCTGREANDGD